MDDRDILEALATGRDDGAAALATVVAVKGSTPRGVGSKLLIGADGSQIGTIGGGCGEADVLEAARDVIESRVARLVRVELIDDIRSFSPAVCGGVMEIFVEPVRRQD